MRRLKIFPIDERALVDMLGCWRGAHFLQLPTGPQIPEGCKIVSAHHSWECRALMVMLEHESFEEVPDGTEPPRGDFVEYEALERIPVGEHFQPAGVMYYPVAASELTESELLAIKRFKEKYPQGVSVGMPIPVRVVNDSPADIQQGKIDDQLAQIFGQE